MQERTAQILEAAVREFIAGGEPISSGLLYRHHDFGIRPAMIRHELEELVRKGFLEQPHHSAGRIPTDRGYEFFAEKMLQSEEFHSSAEGRDKHLASLFEQRAWDDLLEEISSQLGILGVVSSPKEEVVRKDGLENLIENLDWETPGEVKSVIRDFVELEDRLKMFGGKLHGGAIQVFIGRKSPITKSKNLVLVAGEYDIGDEEVLVLAIGPKRMDYQKTFNVFRCFNE
ncbi:hypothetical protein C4571_03680 [Candidatus Parcubacteria bacterium]|nr:MAG: hypothetical protein C4571_03680 [Candidatus Parcubacteria bacterium]